MYLLRKDVQNLLAELKTTIVGGVSERADFLLALFDADDWSFVIKSHGLIEATLTTALLDLIGDTRLRPIFERLPLSDSQIGKVVALKHLGVLTEQHRRFIRWYSELRNELVHQVKNVDFSFLEHVKTLDQNQRKVWFESMLWFTKTEDSFNQWKPIAETLPKAALFVGIILLLSHCSMAGTETQTYRELDELSMKYMTSLFTDET